jgi:hypothetical protein
LQKGTSCNERQDLLVLQVKLLSPGLFLKLLTPVPMREWKPLAISRELAPLPEKKEAIRASTEETDWDVHSAAIWSVGLV